MLTQDQKRTLYTWQLAKEALTSAKEQESAARDRAIDLIFPTRQEGATTIEITPTHSVTCTQPYTRSVDPDELKKVLKSFPRGSRKKLIKEKPTLIKKAYDALDTAGKTIFDDCLTVKPGKPSLKIVTKKSDEV